MCIFQIQLCRISLTSQCICELMTWASICYTESRRIHKLLLSGLHTANLSWQTLVGKPKLVCVWTAQKQAVNTFANCWCQKETCLPTVQFHAVHTHQLEFANTSLPTLVCSVKAALHSLAWGKFASAVQEIKTSGAWALTGQPLYIQTLLGTWTSAWSWWATTFLKYNSCKHILTLL